MPSSRSTGPPIAPEAAVDGWQRIFSWFGTYLKGEG